MVTSGVGECMLHKHLCPEMPEIRCTLNFEKHHEV